MNKAIKKIFQKKLPWLAMAIVVALLAGSVKAQVTEHQVGVAGASTIFSFYNTSPESLDGNTLVYVRCIKEPSGRNNFAPAELWVCDRDLQHHRKVTDIAGTAAHNGVEAQWIDNDRVAFFDNGAVRLVNVRTGKDLLKKPVRADGLGHNPHGHKILYDIYTDDGRGAQGIYELDCNTQQTRMVLATKECAKIPLPSYLQPKDVEPVANWRLLHSQYSPDGKKIAFRLDVGSLEKAQLLGVCNIDGSGLKIMNKSLHFAWYDNHSIVGHFQVDKNGKKPQAAERRYALTRWDVDGTVLEEMMTPPGNHLALSPDRKWFASETFYQTNPVVLKLYSNGHPDKTITVASFDPFDVTWKRRFHVNPAFSRDGKRLYFCHPLNSNYNGTFYCDIR